MFRGRKETALTPGQEIALQRLAAGSSIVQAARPAQVDRRTLYRWLHSDPQFVAAYNAWQRETVASGRGRVLAMGDLALDTVQSAMLQGNARVAVQVAKANGALDAPKPGLTNPERFRRRKRLRDAKWQKALADAESSEAFNKRSRELHRSPAHCEYMIDAYIKARREALRDESPEDRARRLAEQPKYHRNYDPFTLRLLATLDAEQASAPPDPDAANPPSANAPAEPPIASAERENTVTEANATEPADVSGPN